MDTGRSHVENRYQSTEFISKSENRNIWERIQNHQHCPLQWHSSIQERCLEELVALLGAAKPPGGLAGLGLQN